VTCDRSVVISVSSGFLHQWNWPSWYNWNIVESGIKHHQTTKSISFYKYFITSCHPWVHSINNLQTDYLLLLVIQNLSFNSEAVVLIVPLKLIFAVSISNCFVSSTDPFLTTSWKAVLTNPASRTSLNSGEIANDNITSATVLPLLRKKWCFLSKFLKVILWILILISLVWSIYENE